MIRDENGLYSAWAWGLLVIRVGFGLAFLWHGAPKLFGGTETWVSIGEKGMGSLGIHWWPAFWGLMAGVAEFGGGLLMILGVFFRSGLALMIFTMIAAIAFHVSTGKGSSNHAMEALVIFSGLMLIGPGPITLNRFLPRS
ncbi:MAG: DoxX family protein [Fidelibacterota bacterium]